MSHKKFSTLGLCLIFAMAAWLLGPATPAMAAACSSIGSGNWNIAGTWLNCSEGIPTSSDSVSIGSGHSVTLDTSPVTIASLTVNGTLNLGSGSALTVNGDVSIAAGGTLNGNASTLGLTGGWSNSGTFTAGSGTVIFNGSGSTYQTITGYVTAFYDLTINSGAKVEIPATNIPTVSSSMINNGTLKQTQTVNGSGTPVTVKFLEISSDKYRGVDISTSNDLGSVTVTIRHLNSGEYCTTSGIDSYVKRCFDITGTSGAANIKLWALTSENLPISTASLVVYHHTTTGWAQLLTNRANGTVDSGTYIYASGDTTGFSGFLLGDINIIPTAVELTSFRALQAPAGGLQSVALAALLVLLVAGEITLQVQRKR